MDEAIKNIQEATELYLEDDYEEVKNHIYSPVFLTSLSAKVAHHG
jgi:predicted RNase H-like HicB family nuclease